MLSDYIEVAKPRIVVVLVVTAITSSLAATRFDSTPLTPWDISPFHLLFIGICGCLASMGSSALNHYFDRDIDKIMSRTVKRPIPAGRLEPKNVLIYGIVLCASSVIISFLTLNVMAMAMIA
ncbi:MAG: UbiA family prenyltransferase, partial [Thermoproteota archaeon]|nr:UbiA family prenyltransferase [Thermoproteota archaeon]